MFKRIRYACGNYAEKPLFDMPNLSPEDYDKAFNIVQDSLTKAEFQDTYRAKNKDLALKSGYCLAFQKNKKEVFTFNGACVYGSKAALMCNLLWHVEYICWASGILINYSDSVRIANAFLKTLIYVRKHKHTSKLR